MVQDHLSYCPTTISPCLVPDKLPTYKLKSEISDLFCQILPTYKSPQLMSHKLVHPLFCMGPRPTLSAPDHPRRPSRARRHCLPLDLTVATPRHRAAATPRHLSAAATPRHRSPFPPQPPSRSQCRCRRRPSPPWQRGRGRPQRQRSGSEVGGGRSRKAAVAARSRKAVEAAVRAARAGKAAAAPTFLTMTARGRRRRWEPAARGLRRRARQARRRRG